MADIIKILESKNPDIFIMTLDESGILDEILPELTDLKGQEFINGKGHKDNFKHCVQVLKQTAERTDDIWIRFLALLHDIGKAPTKRFDPKIGWTFHNHEEVGTKMVKKICKRLDINDTDKKHLESLMILNGQVKNVVGRNITDSAVRRFYTDAAELTFDLTLFAKCDITTKYEEKKRKFIEEIEELETRIIILKKKDEESKWRPPITGKDIMELFDLKPSKEVGIIMNKVVSAIKNKEIEENREACLEYLNKILD